MFWLFGFLGRGRGSRVNPNIVRIVMHIEIYGRSLKSVWLSVCRRSQTAGRNSCSIVSVDVSNSYYRLTVSCHEFASLFGLAFFYTRKTSKISVKSAGQRVCVWMTMLPAMNASGVGRHGWAQPNSVNMYRGVCVFARACACVRDVFAIYDNNIWPRLIMIITKISILYFIQIRQTYDFPSTGTRLVYHNVAVFSRCVCILCIHVWTWRQG